MQSSTFGSSVRVTVIGAGFAGALTTAHLVHRGVDVTLIDRGSRAGRGVAYRHNERGYLLNVPAGRMSAWLDRPDDFVNWLRQQDPDAAGDLFARRSDYGQYLEGILARAHASGRVTVVKAQAMDLDCVDDRFVTTVAGGRRVVSHAVVLALGNAAPRPIVRGATGQSEYVIENPFAMSERVVPRPDDTVALAGTGLTALDVLMWLEETGHRGRVIAFSRRGRAPIPHVGHAPASLPALPDRLRRRPTIRHISAWLKGLAASLEAFGIDPARAVDALRPITGELWQRLPIEERRRFLRHARALWDQRRHRAPAAACAVLERGIAAGRIEVRAARLESVRVRSGRGLHLALRPRGSRASVGVDVDWLVNCTGPERDLTRQPDALVQSLLRRGLLQPDDLRLGAMTADGGELIDRSGVVVPRAFVVGGWRMAGLFESTAVPELRVQAARTANLVADAIGAFIDANAAAAQATA